MGMGGRVFGAGEDTLATGEPAEEFTNKNGFFPTSVSESFWVDLAEAYVVCPAVYADSTFCEDRVVWIGASKNVALEYTEENEHCACFCISCARLSDGGWDWKTRSDDGLEYGKE